MFFLARDEHKTKHFSIVFDGKKEKTLGPAHIKSLQIDRSLDNSYVFGTLKFVDRFNFVEKIPLNKNNKIEIHAVCCQNIEYKETFIAIDTKVTPIGVTQSNVVISFVDEDSYKFMCQTMTRTFKDMYPAKVLFQILSEEMVSEKNLEVVGNEDHKPMPLLTIPGNKPLIASMNQMARKFNMKFFQTKNKIVVKSYDKIIKDSTVFKQTYIFSHLNPSYLYKVLEYKIVKMGPGSAVGLITPKQKIFSVDPTDLRQQLRVYSTDTMEKDQKTLTEKKIEYQDKHLAERSVYKHAATVKDDVRYSYSNTVNEANIIEVMITGTFEYPDVGQRVSIGKEKIDRKPDQNISGYWLVKGVSFLFLATGLFLIKLTLVRSGYKDVI